MPFPVTEFRALDIIQNRMDGRIDQFSQLLDDQKRDLEEAVPLLSKSHNILDEQQRQRRDQLTAAMEQRENDMQRQLRDLGHFEQREGRIIQRINNMAQANPLGASDQLLLDRIEERRQDYADRISELNDHYNEQKDILLRKRGAVPEGSQRGWLGRKFDKYAGGLGLEESEDGVFYRITGKGDVNPYTGERMPSDRQIRETIKRLVLEQGCTTLYAYKGNKIDPQLTQRMKAILMDMKYPGHVLEGHQNVRVSSQLMTELEPWRADNPLTNAFHKVALWKQDRSTRRADEGSILEENRGLLNPLSGRGLKDLNPFNWM